MRTTLLLSAFVCLLASGGASRAQDTYPLACNQQCIPNYEYVNTMSMSSNNKEYYTVFIVVFAWLFLKEPITRLKFLAVGMAFAGAVIILY